MKRTPGGDHYIIKVIRNHFYASDCHEGEVPESARTTTLDYKCQPQLSKPTCMTEREASGSNSWGC
jgi:hypothetical protein